MRKTKALSALLAAVMCLSGCGTKTETTTAKPEAQQTETEITTEKTENTTEEGATETTAKEDTPVSEETTLAAASISSIDSYDFNLDEAFDTTMDNNISDNIKFSVKITALKDTALETAQDAYENGFNENNSNTITIPFEGYMTYGDLCGMKGLELEPANYCQGFNEDGTPNYQFKENLVIYHPVVDKEQDIYTENGKELGVRKFEFSGIEHNSATQKIIENENQITSQWNNATYLECVSNGEVITDKNAIIPDDAIIKGISCGSNPYCEITFYMTLENGETIELAGEKICDHSNAKKYFREIGLITTNEDDEIYRYEMRENDNARLLVFKNNNAVMVIEFTWNGGYFKNIFLIKR